MQGTIESIYIQNIALNVPKSFSWLLVLEIEMNFQIIFLFSLHVLAYTYV